MTERYVATKLSTREEWLETKFVRFGEEITLTMATHSQTVPGSILGKYSWVYG